MSESNPFSRMSTGGSKITRLAPIIQTPEKIKYFEMGERCKEIEILSKLEKFLEILLINSNDQVLMEYEDIFKDYLK